MCSSTALQCSSAVQNTFVFYLEVGWKFLQKVTEIIVCSRWVGTYQLFKKWNFSNVLPTHDKMQWSCAALLLLHYNNPLIMCSNIAMKVRLGDTRCDSICDVTKACDRHDEISLCVVNIVVELMDVYGERWLTWVLMVCNHHLPVSLMVLQWLRRIFEAAGSAGA